MSKSTGHVAQAMVGKQSSCSPNPGLSLPPTTTQQPMEPPRGVRADFKTIFQSYVKSRRGTACQYYLNAVYNTLEEFEKFELEKNPAFSLARLGHVYMAGESDLLQLPRCTDWLASRYPCVYAGEVVGDGSRHEAYQLLLDFLKNLLEEHKTSHITREQYDIRRKHLFSLPSP